MKKAFVRVKNFFKELELRDANGITFEGVIVIVICVAILLLAVIPGAAKYAEYKTESEASVPNVFIGNMINDKYDTCYEEVAAAVDGLDRSKPVTTKAVVTVLDVGDLVEEDDFHVSIRLENGNVIKIFKSMLKVDGCSYDFGFDRKGAVCVYNGVGVEKLLDIKGADASMTETGLCLFNGKEITVEELAAIKSIAESVNSYERITDSGITGQNVNGWTIFLEGYWTFMIFIACLLILVLMFVGVIFMFG